jgi:hypothetical protein
MSQATSWVNHLAATNPNPKYPNQGYPAVITQRVGKDLDQILGPVSQRRPYDQISQTEVESRLELVDEKLFLANMRGGKQQLLQTFYDLLEHLEATKALWGIDIPLMNIMPMEGVERHAVEKLWINYRSQRTLYARHIVQIVFKFETTYRQKHTITIATAKNVAMHTFKQVVRQSAKISLCGISHNGLNVGLLISVV